MLIAIGVAVLIGVLLERLFNLDPTAWIVVASIVAVAYIVGA